MKTARNYWWAFWCGFSRTFGLAPGGRERHHYRCPLHPKFGDWVRHTIPEEVKFEIRVRQMVRRMDEVFKTPAWSGQMDALLALMAEDGAAYVAAARRRAAR